MHSMTVLQHFKNPEAVHYRYFVRKCFIKQFSMVLVAMSLQMLSEFYGLSGVSKVLLKIGQIFFIVAAVQQGRTF